MSRIKIYEYSKCSTCRKGLKYLEQHNIPFEKIPIIDQPPTKEELAKALKQYNSDLRKLFNTSGVVYREMKLSKKIKTMTAEEGIDLLSKNGKLVKRPLIITENETLVGFKEEEWDAVLNSPSS